MARDNALPYSTTLQKINSKVHSPLYAIAATVTAEAIVGIVVFGSNYAFQAIISLGGAAIQIGYLVPILMVCSST